MKFNKWFVIPAVIVCSLATFGCFCLIELYNGNMEILETITVVVPKKDTIIVKVTSKIYSTTDSVEIMQGYIRGEK